MKQCNTCYPTMPLDIGLHMSGTVPSLNCHVGVRRGLGVALYRICAQATTGVCWRPGGVLPERVSARSEGIIAWVHPCDGSVSVSWCAGRASASPCPCIGARVSVSVPTATDAAHTIANGKSVSYVLAMSVCLDARVQVSPCSSFALLPQTCSLRSKKTPR